MQLADSTKCGRPAYWILDVAKHACVRVRDSALCATQCADGVDSHITMHVLGWNPRQAVLGCSVKGASHFRVLSTRDFPRDTKDRLEASAKATVRVPHEHAYTTEDFVPARFHPPDSLACVQHGNKYPRTWS